MKITKKTNINELIRKKPELANEFFRAGMMCIGCPMAVGETLEQGCKVHGMPDKEIDKLVEELNKKSEKKKKLK